MNTKFHLNLLYAQLPHIQAACLFNVNAIDAEESLLNKCAAIVDNGVADGGGYHFHGHAGLYANTIVGSQVLSSNAVFCHVWLILYCLCFSY